MTPEQFQRIEDAFSEACLLPVERRASFLDEVCGDDALVRSEVEAMLAADARETHGLSAVAARPSPSVVGASGDTRVDGDAQLRAESIPERIGRYRILRECGHGGMGVVYEAEQESPSRHVALKVVRSGLVSKEVLRRFRHETEVLGRLQHPGIAQIFEAGSSAGDGDERRGQPFIAMEFVDGTELPAYAASRGLDTTERLSLFTLVCDAVQHAHERGVIHRDLKPANILVVPPNARGGTGALADEVGQPKVLDFGIARLTGADMQVTTMMTHAGQLIGTLQYMSPEQASEGTMPVDARSDVYALGVVLHELLVGTLPYDLTNLTIPDAVVVIRRGEPKRIGTLDRALAGDVETIVAKCLEKDPERRYPSAAALAEDVRRHLRSEPITARPPSTWYQARKFARRNRPLVAGALATFGALVVGLIASTSFAFRAQENATRAEKSEARALASEAAALRRAYVSNLAAATALSATDPSVAKEQLDAAPAELRDWEWDHVSRQLKRFTRVYEGSAIAADRLGVIQRLVDVAFASDGSLLVGALPDGRVAAWDPVTTRMEHVGIELAGATIRALAVPALGPPLVALGTWDGRVRVWDVDRDRWLTVHDGDDPVWFVAWDAAGERLAFRTSTAIGLWSETGPAREIPVEPRLDRGFVGDEQWMPSSGRQRDLAFTEDGERVVAVVRVGVNLAHAVWDADTGDRVPPLPEETSETSAPTGASGDEADRARQYYRATSAASHDGSRLARASGLRSAVVLNAETLAEELVLRGHRNSIKAIAWTIDDRRILTSSHDGTIRTWDAATGAALDVLEADPGSPLAIAPDGSGVAHRVNDELAFWNFAPAAEVLHPSVSYVYALTYSPDGSLLAAASKYSNDVTVFDALDGRIVRTIDTGEPSYRLHFAADGGRLFNPRTIDVFDGGFAATEAPPIERLPLAERMGVRATNGKAISPNGELLAMSTQGGWDVGESVVVRDLESNEVVLDVDGPYWGVAFSPDGKLLAAALEHPGRVEVWDLERKERIALLRGHGTHAYCVEFHPDGSRLATGGNDNTVRLWDTTTWEQVLELRGHTSYVFVLDFSPDGTQLASGSGDLTVRVWDTVPRHVRRRQALEARFDAASSPAR